MIIIQATEKNPAGNSGNLAEKGVGFAWLSVEKITRRDFEDFFQGVGDIDNLQWWEKGKIGGPLFAGEPSLGDKEMFMEIGWVSTVGTQFFREHFPGCSFARTGNPNGTYLVRHQGRFVGLLDCRQSR